MWIDLPISSMEAITFEAVSSRMKGAHVPDRRDIRSTRTVDRWHHAMIWA
ncbi:hypothetical protein AB0J90_27035 [Micromonospora sp. NPDC049523]